LGENKGRKKDEPNKYIFNIFYFILPIVKYTNFISNKKTNGKWILCPFIQERVQIELEWFY